MKNTSFKLFLLLFFSFFLSLHCVLAAEEGEFLQLKKHYIWQNDGSMELRCYKELKVNSLMAINRLYGETFIIYNPEYQELKIHSSYTLRPDGTIINTPANAFNEVLPAFAANAPAYNYLKEMVITHTALEPDAIICLDYSIISKPGFIKFLDIHENLQQESPVKNYQLSITLPKNQKLNYQLYGTRGKVKTEQFPQTTCYTWKLKNIPARPHEPYQQVYSEFNPRFIASAFPSGTEALKYLSEQIIVAPDAYIRHFTRQLIESENSLNNKIFTIRNFLTQQLATVNIPPYCTGWKLRTPEQILSSAYANPTEKISLFSTMLEAAGIANSIVVVYPALLKQNPKSLHTIQDLMIYTQSGTTPLFLNTNGKNQTAPELSPEKFEYYLLSARNILPLTVLNHSGEIKGNTKIQIRASETILTGNLQLNGGFLVPDEKTAYETNIKEIAHIPGTPKEIKLVSSDPYRIEVNFNTTDTLQKIAENHFLYQLPESAKGVTSWQMNQLSTIRNTPLIIPFPIHESYRYEINTETPLKWKNKNFILRYTKSIGNVTISYETQGDKLVVKREIAINRSLIYPKEYNHLKNLLDIWNENNYKQLIISK